MPLLIEWNTTPTKPIIQEVSDYAARINPIIANKTVNDIFIKNVTDYI